MKALILIILSTLVLGCGGGGSSNSGKVEPPTVTAPTVPEGPVLLPMDYAADHKVYILGGQSNAVRLLYAVNGLNVDSTTGTADLVAGSSTVALTGAVKGSTGIDYWLDDTNSAGLFNLLGNQCSKVPYFIWYQGEANIWDEASTYKKKLITFFNKIITVCPKVAILEVSIALDADYYSYDSARQIINIQESLNSPIIKAKSFGDQYGYYGHNHLVNQGYLSLWNEILSRFPLK